MQYHPPNASWPNPEIMKTMPFDYTVHDPKYDDISSIYNPGFKPESRGSFKVSHARTTEINCTRIVLKCMLIVSVTQHKMALIVLAKETPFARRTFTCAGGRVGLSSLNTQPTTPTITVNNVSSTWASTPGTRWAESSKRSPVCFWMLKRWCSVSSLITDVWVNAAHLHIDTFTAGRRNPAILYHSKV